MQTVPPLEDLLRGEEDRKMEGRFFFLSYPSCIFDELGVEFETGADRRLCSVGVCCTHLWMFWAPVTREHGDISTCTFWYRIILTIVLPRVCLISMKHLTTPSKFSAQRTAAVPLFTHVGYDVNFFTVRKKSIAEIPTLKFNQNSLSISCTNQYWVGR